MDWISAVLGWLFVRTTVTGAVVISMFFAYIGQYAFAAAIGLPLALVVLWMAADLRDDWPPDPPN